MDSLRPQIVQHLGTLSEPISARDLAVAIATAADAAEIRNDLRDLVLQHRVKRHHNSDGILRYSLIDKESREDSVDPTRAASEQPVTSALPSQTKAVSVGALQAKMLSLLSVTPISPNDLAVRGSFTSKQTSNLLQLLQGKGLAIRHGNLSHSTWSLVDPMPPISVDTSKAESPRAARRDAEHMAKLERQRVEPAPLEALPSETVGAPHSDARSSGHEPLMETVARSSPSVIAPHGEFRPSKMMMEDIARCSNLTAAWMAEGLLVGAPHEVLLHLATAHQGLEAAQTLLTLEGSRHG